MLQRAPNYLKYLKQFNRQASPEKQKFFLSTGGSHDEVDKSTVPPVSEATSASASTKQQAQAQNPYGRLKRHPFFPQLTSFPSFRLTTKRVDTTELSEEDWLSIHWIYRRLFYGFSFEVLKDKFMPGSNSNKTRSEFSLFYNKNGDLVGYDGHETIRLDDADVITTQAATTVKGGDYITYETIRYIVSEYFNNLFRFIFFGTSVDLTFLSPNINWLSSLLFTVLYGSQPHVSNQLLVEVNELKRAVSLAAKAGWKYRPEYGFIVFETGNNPQKRVEASGKNKEAHTICKLHKKFDAKGKGLGLLFWLNLIDKEDKTKLLYTIFNLFASLSTFTRSWMQVKPQKAGKFFVNVYENTVHRSDGKFDEEEQFKLEEWSTAVAKAQQEQSSGRLDLRK